MLQGSGSLDLQSFKISKLGNLFRFEKQKSDEMGDLSHFIIIIHLCRIQRRYDIAIYCHLWMLSRWLPWQPLTVMTRSRRLIPMPSNWHDPKSSELKTIKISSICIGYLRHVAPVVITLIKLETNWLTNWHPDPTLKTRIDTWNQSIFAAQPMPRCDKFQSLIRPGLTLKHESCRKQQLSDRLAPSQLSWLNAKLKSCQIISIFCAHAKQRPHIHVQSPRPNGHKGAPAVFTKRLVPQCQSLNRIQESSYPAVGCWWNPYKTSCSLSQGN